MLKCFLIHVSYHQNFRRLIILYDDRKQTLRIQLKFREIHTAFKGCHLDAFCRTFFLVLFKIHFPLTDIFTGNSTDTRTLQNSEQFRLFHRVCHHDAWNIYDIHDRIQIHPVHKDQFTAVLPDNMLLFKQFIEIFDGNGNFLFPVYFFRLFCHFQHPWFWKVQNCFLCTHIKNPLDIFYFFYMSTNNHRNLDHSVDLSDQIDGLIIFLFTLCQIEDKKLIRSSITIFFCKFYNIMSDYFPIIEPFDSLSICNQNAGNQSFITH